MSAIESGVPDILFARFNLASAGLLCPASAWTGGGGASSATPCGCRRDDNGICDGGERCRRGALVYWCVRSAGWGRIRPCIPGRGCLGGGLMSVTGSCWRGTEAVSLCPGQIRRVSGDGLKKKNPRRRWRLRGCLYSWRREGPPKIDREAPWRVVPHSAFRAYPQGYPQSPPPPFKRRATAVADDAGQADTVRCPMLRGLP